MQKQLLPLSSLIFHQCLSLLIKPSFLEDFNFFGPLPQKFYPHLCLLARTSSLSSRVPLTLLVIRKERGRVGTREIATILSVVEINLAGREVRPVMKYFILQQPREWTLKWILSLSAQTIESLIMVIFDPVSLGLCFYRSY